jgi:hypothetical protein
LSNSFFGLSWFVSNKHKNKNRRNKKQTKQFLVLFCH